MRSTNHTRENLAQRTVQDAVHATVFQTQDAAGECIPAKAIAQNMNVPVSVLYEIADEYRERKLRAEEIPSLILATRNFAVLDTIERAVGRVGVALPVAGDGITLARSAEAIREFGEFLREIGQAAIDGTVTRDEAAQVRLEGEHTIAMVYALITQTESQVRETRALKAVMR